MVGSMCQIIKAFQNLELPEPPKIAQGGWRAAWDKVHKLGLLLPGATLESSGDERG